MVRLMQQTSVRKSKKEILLIEPKVVVELSFVLTSIFASFLDPYRLSTNE